MNRAMDVARNPTAKMPKRSNSATKDLRPKKEKYLALSLGVINAKD
jgi:hypothetical protein